MAMYWIHIWLSHTLISQERCTYEEATHGKLVDRQSLMLYSISAVGCKLGLKALRKHNIKEACLIASLDLCMLV